MEVNLSPSLATDSPLDVKIKSNLLVDTFNLVGIRKFDRRRDNLTKMKNRVKNIMRAKSYQSRQNNPSSAAASKQVLFAGEEKSKRMNNGLIPGKAEDFGAESEFFLKNRSLIDKVSVLNFKLMVLEHEREAQRHGEGHPAGALEEEQLHKDLPGEELGPLRALSS